jgi:hypothetical protein
MKPDETVIPPWPLGNEIESSVALLVPVTVCEGLVDPTATTPKLRLVGVTVKLGGSANVRLAVARPSSRRRAKVKTENVKPDDFGCVMNNPPEYNPRNERQ